MPRNFGGIRDHEVQLRKWIRDAAELARGKPAHELSCWLDGIRTPSELADAIEQCGESYIQKMRAISKAAPVVRGDTISIYQPEESAPNAPSIEDERFLADCRQHLLKHGFVRAADADTYEEIAKRYPGAVHPPRVRGAEARRYLAMRDPDFVSRKIKLKYR